MGFAFDVAARVSTLEHARPHNHGMPRRRPTKAERERVITLDLLADWRPYAEPSRGSRAR